MLPFSRLLEVDDLHSSPEAVPDCLGDSYLCAKNSIYRTIRHMALKDGVIYSCQDTPLWRDYQVAALLFLDKILKTKVVPYSATKTTLQRVMREINPSFAVSVKLLYQMLKKNYLLHETCHCIAHTRIPAKCPAEAYLSPGQEEVVRLLLGESFAATTERMAWAMVDSPTHAVFFSLNSYIGHNPEHLEQVRAVVEKLGMFLLFRLSLLVFFWNNLAKRPLNEAEVTELMDYFYGTNDAVRNERDKLVVLFTKVLSISERFLDATTPAYFRLIGLESDFEKLTASPLHAEDIARLCDGKVLDDLTSLVVQPCVHTVALAV